MATTMFEPLIILVDLGSIAAWAAGGVSMTMVLAALVAYRMLRRTMKWAFRMAIVAILLLAAITAGSLVLFYGFAEAPPAKPAVNRPVRR